MATDYLTWRAPRIHGELLMLGFDVSEATVSRYLPKNKPTEKQLKQWITFLRNHKDAIAGMDFFVVPSITFRLMYVFFAIHHGRRKLLHFNVTYHPHAEWVKQQLREAFPDDGALPKYLIFDNDKIFCPAVVKQIKSFGIEPKRTAIFCPWQNPILERWVQNARRECVNHIIPFSRNHLTRILYKYTTYYNESRCHYNLDKDAPLYRESQKRKNEKSKLIAIPQVGGLHHRYEWKNAA